MAIETDRQLRNLTTDQLRLLHEEAAGGSYKKMGDRITLRNTNHHDQTLSDYKKDQEINYSYYDPSEEVQERLEESGSRANWGLVKEAMGLKDIGSEKDLEAMRRLVNQEYAARKIESQTGDLDKRISALEAGEGQEKETDNKATIINAGASGKGNQNTIEEAMQKSSIWKQEQQAEQASSDDGQDAKPVSAEEMAATYKAQFDMSNDTNSFESDYATAKERATNFSLNNKKMLHGQDPNRPFEGNIAEFAHAPRFQGIDPEGI